MASKARPLGFEEVRAAEHDAINSRRRHLNRDDVALLPEARGRPESDRTPVMCGPGVFDTVGVALSGGGIRSAAFCLGALQALDATPAEGGNDAKGAQSSTVLERVDYVSTVSGGGYIGTSMILGMSANGGTFPFASRLDQDETLAVQHIRNYSNYLLPRGFGDAFVSVAIYLRGIVANIILVLPVLLIFAAATIGLNAHLADSPNAFFHDWVIDLFGVPHFIVTAFLAAVLGVVVALWAFARIRPVASDITRLSTRLIAIFIGVVLLSAFLELQPIVLSELIEARRSVAAGESWWPSINAISGALASFAAVISFLGGKIADVIERGSKSATWRAWLAGLAGKAMVWIAAAALPVVLWAVYIYLSFWGLPTHAIEGKQPGTASSPPDSQSPSTPDGQLPSAPDIQPPVDNFFGPEWLEKAASILPPGHYQIAMLYFAVAIVVFLIGCLLLSPNANSLHQLYRDRLGKAFLFDPRGPTQNTTDPKPLDATKLSALRTQDAPYLLINAALNIHGSKFVNRRGRNAEFFLFSPKHVGSVASGFAPIETMERDEPSLDVGTAMAVSGAAASSNMGSASVRPLTPTLALLNVRLGFWMRNPRYAGKDRPWINFYLLNEILSRLNEKREQVYLSDGGHIENLGIYQLLKRHCGLIIAVDGEADPTMSFNSFVKLQQYARIDLGVRIELPWQGIRDATLATGAVIAERGWAGDRCSIVGPHCALGRILYPNGGQGILLYVKASLSGDENDYVVDYKRRYPAYPHETTSDQFFSEEQFEVYRALGFHALKGFLDKKAVAALSMHGVAAAAAGAAAAKVAPHGAEIPAAATAPPAGVAKEYDAVQATRNMLGLPDQPPSK